LFAQRAIHILVDCDTFQPSEGNFETRIKQQLKREENAGGCAATFVKFPRKANEETTSISDLFAMIVTIETALLLNLCPKRIEHEAQPACKPVECFRCGAACVEEHAYVVDLAFDLGKKPLFVRQHPFEEGGGFGVLEINVGEVILRIGEAWEVDAQRM